MRTMTTKSLIVSTILLFAFCAALITTSATAGITVRVIKDTDVKVKFVSDEKISSGKLAKGDSLELSLVDPIIVDDSTIVPVGASGKAVISKVEKNGKRGKPGYIQVKFVNLTPEGPFKTADGAPIMLSGQVEDKGSSKKFLSWVLGFGFLISGGNGEIDRDAVYTAKTVETVRLTSE
jgi:hypothetical protein